MPSSSINNLILEVQAGIDPDQEPDKIPTGVGHRFMSVRPNRFYRYQMYASLRDEKSVYASAASGPPKLMLGLDHPLGALRWRAGRECFRDGERNVTTEELQTNGLMCGRASSHQKHRNGKVQHPT